MNAFRKVTVKGFRRVRAVRTCPGEQTDPHTKNFFIVLSRSRFEFSAPETSALTAIAEKNQSVIDLNQPFRDFVVVLPELPLACTAVSVRGVAWTP
jgi:hypothetical protein